jgi:hypothetical protein
MKWSDNFLVNLLLQIKKFQIFVGGIIFKIGLRRRSSHFHDKFKNYLSLN